MLEPTAPLTDIVAALEAREIGALELLDSSLDRIDRLDGDINAVVTREPERARAEALAIDDARANGVAVGPLAGVPITIKDALATEGIRSTGGARELRDHVPADDATAVAALRQAGAVVFGKTNLPRWSGDYQSHNDLFGTTNNPWDTSCTPGGSSGGAAAAVAMGFTPFEIGTDIGGSIRCPASFCGIFGHKPSFGVVPTHGYLDSRRFHRNVADVNVFGPLTRSIDDLELVFELIAGPSDDDAPAWRLELPPPRAHELGDFRVAAWLDDPFCPVDPSVKTVLDRAVAALEAAGARVDHERRPNLDALDASIIGANLIGMATDISDSDDIDAPTLDANLLSHRQWDVLHRQRQQIRRQWHSFFADVDVLLCPVTPTPAFHHVHSATGSNWAHATLSDYDDMPYRHLLRWNTLIGSAYLPVTTPPIGRTAPTDTAPVGLPVGIQVVAPYLHDHTALTFARRIAEVVGGYEAPPGAAS